MTQKKYLSDLLKECTFADGDGERAKAVTVAMTLTLYCRHLFDDPWIQRPGFIFSGNDTGAGKTTRANLGLVTLLGDAPTGTMPEDKDEMRCPRRSLRGKLTPSALLNLGGSYNS